MPCHGFACGRPGSTPARLRTVGGTRLYPQGAATSEQQPCQCWEQRRTLGSAARHRIHAQCSVSHAGRRCSRSPHSQVHCRRPAQGLIAGRPCTPRVGCTGHGPRPPPEPSQCPASRSNPCWHVFVHYRGHPQQPQGALLEGGGGWCMGLQWTSGAAQSSTSLQDKEGKFLGDGHHLGRHSALATQEPYKRLVARPIPGLQT